MVTVRYFPGSADHRFFASLQILIGDVEFLKKIVDRGYLRILIGQPSHSFQKEVIILFDLIQSGIFNWRHYDGSRLIILEDDQHIFLMKSVEDPGCLSAVKLGYGYKTIENILIVCHIFRLLIS